MIKKKKLTLTFIMTCMVLNDIIIIIIFIILLKTGLINSCKFLNGPGL